MLCGLTFFPPLAGCWEQHNEGDSMISITDDIFHNNLLKMQVIKLEERYGGESREANAPRQGFQAKVLDRVLCSAFVLTVMKGFSMVNGTAAYTEASFFPLMS